MTDVRANGKRADPERGFSAFVHLASALNEADYARRFAEGIEPDASPYGFHHARDFGVDVRFSGRPAQAQSLAARIVRRVLGFDFLNSLRNRREMARADVVWTMRDEEALGAALLMKLRLMPRRPVVASIVWLANDWEKKGALRQRFYRSLLGEIDILLVHSQACLPKLRAIVAPDRVRLLYFGISASVFGTGERPAPVADGGPIRIVAAGNDRTRDWRTLIAAFRDQPGVHVTIVCPWLPREDVAGIANVEALEVVGTAPLAEMYRAADFVAIPMVENIFSGLTVALEAAAIGTAILATRTGGVTTYFEEEDAVFVPPSDAEAMRRAVLATTPDERAAIAARARQRFLTADYSSRAMAGRYAAFTRELLERAPDGA